MSPRTRFAAESMGHGGDVRGERVSLCHKWDLNPPSLFGRQVLFHEA